MELIELFKKLAEIDSVSGEEKELSNFVLNHLKKLGLNPVQDENFMIYCRTGESSFPKLFCAHLDTVEPGRGVKIIEKDGYLVSQGKTIIGGDNKVSLAAVLYTVEKLLKEGKSFDVELVFSVREETDSGIKDIDKSLIQSKVGFIFDLGGVDNFQDVVTQAPTIWDFKIEIIGKSSHGSRPEDGVNALNGLIEFKDRIKFGRLDEKSTFNVGLINGGDATNTVPGHISLAGDLRSTDHETFEMHKESLENSLKQIEKETGLHIKLEWIPYAFGYNLDTSSHNFKKLSQIYLDEFDIKLEHKAVTSGSDAGFLNYMGVETFCLGYCVENSHSVNERIKIDNFYKLQKIVNTLMVKF
ncbi:MAG: hypothetical protein KatS3mg085_261 [Candidatus Dojkabacteria bacterium]|nr:MAG: hypothetical protein KatS3mg085_261 [Candidatus Dojkabacteria bacterium]